MSQATLIDRPYVNSNLFSGYYLDERVHQLESWEENEGVKDTYNQLQELYTKEQDLLDTYNEDNLLDKWIDEVLGILGYGTLQETPLPGTDGFVDRLLFLSEDDRRGAAHLERDGQTTAMYQQGVGILEAKQWDAHFDERFTEQRRYRDASHQIKFYLERTPDTIDWGILTNGRKWRLYGTKDYHTQTYYEVDLPELLDTGDLEQFKYFYTFFRPEAFHDIAGTSFIDTVWAESETASQELGDDLQDNVFTALRVAGQGFLQTNDLDLVPSDTDQLQKLKQQSLVLLYRVMFILYAEDRELIHPSNPGAEQEYLENFSLDQKRTEILETIDTGESFESAYSKYSTQLWSRLQDLFMLIDEGNEELGIPAYNGGLFDGGEHTFLADHQIADRYIAEVIYRLSTTAATDDETVVLADYADLDTRHLGSIYEGLLEHQFRIADTDLVAVSDGDGQVWKPADEVTQYGTVETVEEGSLYVVNDEGERKATGSYYTPDSVVTYIVEQTLDPLLNEIHDDLDSNGFDEGNWAYARELFDRVRELKVLDPAMGSGHFLTKATGYLTDQVMAEVREADTEILIEEAEIRRRIAKECIYGVDVIPMAVELSKLSMWLETLAADQPLAFLDHHLKVGNSLLGTDLEAIDQLKVDTEQAVDGSADAEGSQSSLAEFGATRRGTMEQLMDIYQDFLYHQE